MFPRIQVTSGVTSLRRICWRTYSTTSAEPKYSSKVRAFPFAISKEDAIVELGPYASASAAFTGLLGSLGARLLPGFGFEPLQPTRIQPVYLPAWFIDAEVEAKVADDEGQPQTVTAFLQNSYMPGFVFEPLSRLSFNHIPTDDPIPFTDDLEYQFNSEVSCLPYAISPLSLPEAAQSMSYQEATVNDELRLIPHSVKPNLLAAYPVLLPVYLAQYTFQTFNSESAKVTVILEAHSRNGRIFSETLPESADSQITTRRKSSESISFAGIASVLGLKVDPSVAGELVEYLDDMISAPGAAEALANGAVNEAQKAMPVPVAMDDLRVREYTKKETNYNRHWLMMSAQIASSKLMVERLSHIPNAKGFLFRFDFGSMPKLSRLSGEDAGAKVLEQFNIQGGNQKTVVEQIAEMDAARERTKPQWWKDWEGITSLKAA